MERGEYAGAAGAADFTAASGSQRPDTRVRASRGAPLLAWTLALSASVACASAPRVATTAPASPMSAPVAPQDQRRARVEHGLLPPVQVQGEDVRYELEERMRHYRIPAVSIAVFENYELAWAQAYGFASLEGQARATPHTLFLAGSISKSVNALAALLAVADGRLSLDTPINDQLESWKLPENELTKATPVTLRQLLSHTAGTTVHGFAGYERGAPLPSLQQILDGQPPANSPPVRVDLPPGSSARYSGGGITITQLALLERSKRPYPEVLQSSVLTPLGMSESTFEQALPPERAEHAAVGYDPREAPIPGEHHLYPEMAAAGLWTTPSDLARFFLEIARARAGRPSHVPSPIALEMTTRVANAGPPGRGLGVFLFPRQGTPCFGHNGADAGFMALAVASRDGGFGYVVMTNSDNGSQIFDEIGRAIFAAHGWPSTEHPVTRVPLSPQQRARFVGQYLSGRLPLSITQRGDQLVLHQPIDADAELVPVAPDRLLSSGDGTTLLLNAQGGLGRLPANVPPTRRPGRCSACRTRNSSPCLKSRPGASTQQLQPGAPSWRRTPRRRAMTKTSPRISA
jgi:CubicO group peptidase (beta-lactamase class C family)